MKNKHRPTIAKIMLDKDHEARITTGPAQTYRLEFRREKKGAPWQDAGRMYTDLETAKMDLVRLRFSK